MKLIVTMLILCFLFTGCTGYADINNSNIFTTIFADVKDSAYSVGGFVAKIKSKGLSADGGGATEIEMISGEGDTIDSAFDNMEKQSANTSFYGAARAVVMTDNFTNHDIANYVVRLRQILNSRLTVPVFTMDKEPDILFKANATNNLTVGFELEGLIKTLMKDGKIVNVYLSDILQDISSGYTSYIIPSISVDDNSKVPLISGYSVFKDNKKIGNISFEDSSGLSYILSPHTFTTHSITVSGNEYLVYTKKDYTRIIPTIQDGKLTVDIKQSFKGKLVSNTSFASEIGKDISSKIKEQVKERINKDTKKSLANVQDFESDYLGLTKRLIAKYGNDITMSCVNSLLKNATFNIEIAVSLV